MTPAGAETGATAPGRGGRQASLTTWLRLLDPGRVRLDASLRTLAASLAALLATSAVCRSADLPGGVVVIATVVAVLVSRSLHATTFAHRLSALVHVPVVGVLAALTGRFMLHHTWLGAGAFVGAVWTSRYLMRFGGALRRYGRLALTPLIAVLVVPVPPGAARTMGPLWGGVAGLIAVACACLALSVPPARPTRQAASAALDAALAAASLGGAPASDRACARVTAGLHRAALVVEARLDAARLPDDAARTRLDALSEAVLHAEVLATARPAPPLPVPPPPVAETVAASAATVAPFDRDCLDDAVAVVRNRAAALRQAASRERPAPDVPAPPPRPGGRFDWQPQTRLSAQLAAAMAAAFALGHLCFPRHWVWTVVTAFVVCSAARGRGDVVHRSGLRVAGAFAGSVTGTLVAHLASGSDAASVVVVYGYLLIGLWLRDVTYAAWAFCVTSLLAVLYGLNGEHGSALLVQRPEGILLGSACGIAAAYFVLPLRTETVLRGRAARALRVLQELLAAAREPRPDAGAIRRLARRFDRSVRDLSDAAAPARAHRALLHHLRRPALRRLDDAPPAPHRAPTPHPWRPSRPSPPRRPPRTGHSADWVDTLAACADAARAMAAADPDRLAAARPYLGLAALNLGQVRRRLGHRPDAEPPRPSDGGPAPVARLDALLAQLYARLPAPPQPATARTPSAPQPPGPAPRTAPSPPAAPAAG